MAAISKLRLDCLFNALSIIFTLLVKPLPHPECIKVLILLSVNTVYLSKVELLELFLWEKASDILRGKIMLEIAVAHFRVLDFVLLVASRMNPDVKLGPRNYMRG